MDKRLKYNWIVSVLTLITLFCLTFSPVGWAQHQTIDEREFVEAQTAYINGLAAFENKNYEQALELLNKAYVKLPEHPGVNFALADVYLQINDLENAEYYSKQARNIDPQNKWYHLQLFDIYKANGNNKAAANELNNALSYHPNDPDILYELAQTYTEIGKLKQANDVYNRLLDIKGELSSIRLERLKNFNKLNQKDSAIVELEKIRSLDPGNLSTLHLLSNYYLELDKPDEARQTIEDALQISAKNPKSLLLLADIYVAQTQWDSVAQTVTTIIDDSTISAEHKIRAGDFIYSTFKKHPDNLTIRQVADYTFNTFLELTPQSSKAFALAADFFLATDQNKLALEALEHTTNLNPTNDTAWQKRLQLLLEIKNIRETIRVGEQAANQIPQDPTILYFLGSAYLSNQQYSNAIESLKEAENLPARRPLKANIFGSLADTYAALKQWDSAFQYYQQAVDLDTQNPIILNNYAHYLSEQSSDLAKAEQLALQALKLSPDNTSFLDTVGWIYYKQGEFQKALQYVQKAVRTSRADAEIKEHMGYILHKLNKPDEANSWWQKALEQDSTRTYLKEKINQ